MKTLSQRINESLNEAKGGKKIYVDYHGAMWIAYSPSSGTINYSYSRGLKSVQNFSSYGDMNKNYEPSFCIEFLDATKGLKPISKKDDKSRNTEIQLFKIPVYKEVPIEEQQYDVWGDSRYVTEHPTIKPTKYIYVSWSRMYADKKNKLIVSFFETLREAKGYHGF